MEKLVIERTLRVGSGEERVIEDREVVLGADVCALGRLTFRNCVVHGVEQTVGNGAMRYETAEAAITGAAFENCPLVKCAYLSDCVFTDCGEIDVEDGEIKDCRFVRVGSVSAVRADVARCQFSQLRCCDREDEGMIFLDSCQMEECTFDDVELRGGCLLIEATDAWSVCSCMFTNCRTDRRDGKLCYGSRKAGLIRKREEALEVVDEDSCTGLEDVAV